MRAKASGWRVGSVVLVFVMTATLCGAATAALGPTHAAAADPPAGAATTFVSSPIVPFGAAHAIAAGSDGALWLAADHSIRRMTTSGAVTSWTDPSFGFVHSVAAGPDGALWFADAGAIHRFTTAGVRTTFAAGAGAGEIAAGPDGALWFTTQEPQVGRITTDGVLNTFALPEGMFMTELTTGPDGALWFIANQGNRIGGWRIARMTTDGALSVFVEPSTATPRGITAGPDGSLWFLDSEQGSLERITIDGDRSSYARGRVGAADMTVGPDGAFWITGGSVVARVTTAGLVATFPLPDTEVTAGATSGPDGAVWLVGYGASDFTVNRVQVIGVPSAPQRVTAVAGAKSATIAWEPGADGGSPIIGYTATASPGGASCAWASGPPSCTIGGLAAGVTYQFSVSATTAVGTGPPASSLPVTPTGGSRYHPVKPTRALDSRTAVGGWPGRVQPAGRDLAFDPAIVPVAATAVIMNVTVTEPDRSSYLTVWPAGEDRPTASNLNYGAYKTIANQVTVKLGTGHAVRFATESGGAHVVADVVGWFDDGSGSGGSLYNPMAPTRVMDSRLDDTRVVAGAPRDLAIEVVPADATAVIANITATGSTSGSYLTVWPTGQSQPTTSHVNLAPGETIPNLAVVPFGIDRRISIATNNGSTDVVVDVVGWFSPSAGATFHAMSPLRLLDDRVGTGLGGAWGPNQARTLTVHPPVPPEAVGLVANVTATNPTESSFVRVYPAGQALPNVSNLNFGWNQTIPNLVITPIGTNHGVTVHNANGSVDLVADAVGYFAPT